MIDFEYQIKRSKRATSSTTISIKPTGVVVVSAPPWVPKFLLVRFVEQKADWIRDRLKKTTSNNPIVHQHGDKILYFGKEYSLHIDKNETYIRTNIEHDGEKFVIKISNLHTSQKEQDEIHRIIEKWYLQNGIAIITDKTNVYSQQIGVEYQKITLKKVSSIWGSCSIRNNLNFNRKLIMAPDEIVDYVIIHELCHIVHRNHSSRFWALVREHDPNYLSHRRWLRTNSHLLTL